MRPILPAAVALLALTAVSCATYRTVPTSEPAALTAPAGEGGLRIAGYTTSDGVYHRFEGTVRVEGDSLEFYAPPTKEKGLVLEKPEQRFVLAGSEVSSVRHISGTNYVLTTLLVAVMAAGVLFMMAASAFSGDESMM